MKTSVILGRGDVQRASVQTIDGGARIQLFDDFYATIPLVSADPFAHEVRELIYALAESIGLAADLRPWGAGR